MTYTEPPTSPTPTGLIPAIGVLCLLAGLVLIIAWCQGCSQPAKYPAYCTDEIAFTARLVACVDQAKTREESRECRTKVHRACGIDMTITNGAVAP